jgi:hypothetical protein
MKMKRLWILISAISLFAFSAHAASKEWLHIHVDEKKNDEEKVRINIPISLIEVLVPMVEDEAIRNGRIQMHNKEISASELREIWKAVKEEGDAEFLTVEKRGENVRVYTSGKYLMVQSDKGASEKVNIKIPLAVVDAMLSGEGDQLNLLAGVRALRESGIRDIISVESDDSTVMVWIDDKNLAK